MDSLHKLLQDAKAGKFKGLEDGRAKLTEDDVVMIRQAREARVPVKEIAKAAGVSVAEVYLILSGKRWKALTRTTVSEVVETAPDDTWQARAGANHPLHRKAERAVVVPFRDTPDTPQEVLDAVSEMSSNMTT